MKHKYLLVRNPERFSPETVIFCLWAGKSTREQIHLELIRQVARDLGWFFRLWDNMTDFWLIQKAQEIYPSLNWPSGRILRQDMNISSFFYEFQAKNIEAIENSTMYPKSFIRQMAVTDPDEHFHIQRMAKPCPALSEKRKNLKSVSLDEWEKAGISFCLILTLMGLDALISWLFNF